jgi:hypothetical protein
VCLGAQHRNANLHPAQGGALQNQRNIFRARAMVAGQTGVPRSGDAVEPARSAALWAEEDGLPLWKRLSVRCILEDP